MLFRRVLAAEEVLCVRSRATEPRAQTSNGDPITVGWIEPVCARTTPSWVQRATETWESPSGTGEVLRPASHVDWKGFSY